MLGHKHKYLQLHPLGFKIAVNTLCVAICVIEMNNLPKCQNVHVVMKLLTNQALELLH